MDVDSQNRSLKHKTARTLKWNIIDRVAQQVLYAVTGIVLARELSQADFGLVGAVMVFQAFALLLVDSGFSYALIQRHRPTQLDYSTVLWFNVAMACGIYVVLWFVAPFIAEWFGNDPRLIPLSRVMFTSFILYSLSIVQTNRFMKQMHVRPVAVSNALGLGLGAVVGIVLALQGFGAWAIVWQTIIGAVVRAAVLWIAARWLPSLRFSWAALRSFTSVGLGMMFTSFLNTVFLNLYSFVIGNRVGLVGLGYYSQSDKWSKMSIASMSQILTSTTLPVLSEAQNSPSHFAMMVRKFNRMTAYLLFPALIGMTIVATPLFHTLFGVKWDASIILFRILLIRGLFTVLIGLYSNYLLALGRSRLIVWMEVLRDATAAVALVITWPYMSYGTPANPVLGIEILLMGQFTASVVAWVGTLLCVSRVTGVALNRFIADCLPYIGITAVMCAAVIPAMHLVSPAWLKLSVGIIAGAVVYIGMNAWLGGNVQRDAIAYLRGRMK